MTVIDTTTDLQDLCVLLRKSDYVTLDTEFLRDKTYFPKLCLVQLSAPGEDAVAVDPLADDLDLGPLKALLTDPDVTKVFHAARQDLEIFYNHFGIVVDPIFDTQVAAMVCGYGDSVGYQRLVQDICKAELDKAHQFTNWAYRPLSDKQLQYALDDVIYLKDIYESLWARLKTQERDRWVREEMAILTDPETYEIRPEESWQRLKLKNTKPKTLAAAQKLAAWREEQAMRKNIPRAWVLKDDTLADLAQRSPKAAKDLKRIRNFPSVDHDSWLARAVLDALDDARKMNNKDIPEKEDKPYVGPENAAVFEMLKMLLRIKAAENDVAGRLIATQDEMKILAVEEEPDIKPLKGWRREIFGEDALALKRGEIGLSLKDGEIVISKTNG